MDSKAKNLYDAIEIYKKYRFPLSRGNKTVRQFLSDIYNDYKKETNASVFLDTEDKEAIEKLCDGIIESLTLYDDFDIIGSYSTFFKVMNEVKNRLWYSFVADPNYSYYRIRSGTADKVYSHLEMLHIPFESRHLADTARFSLPGMPSTYMSTMESLAWYETGLPEKFYIAKYDVNTNEINKFKLLNLDINPLLFSRDLQLMILKGKEMNIITPLYIGVAKMFPLLFACSVTVKNKSAFFKEEYTIPQMLMSWVKQSNDFIGIRYNSASGYERASEYNANNIVIPIKEVGADGYCSILKRIFIENSIPKVKFVDYQQKIDRHNDSIDKIRDFYATVKYSRQTSKVELPYTEILDICQSIILNYDLLHSNYSQCSYVCLENIANLEGYVNLIINQLKDKYGSDFSNFTVGEIYEHLLTDEIKLSVQRTLREFQTSVWEFIIDFSNLDFMMLG